MSITITLPESLRVTLPKGFDHDGATTADIRLETFTSDMIERVLAFGFKEYLNNSCAAKDATVDTALKAISRVGEWARSVPSARGPSLSPRARFIREETLDFLRTLGVKAESAREFFKGSTTESAIDTAAGIALEDCIAAYRKARGADPSGNLTAIAKVRAKIDANVAARIAAAADTADLLA